MLQKELAEKWGMSKGQISKLVTSGMPLNSEADALRWRAQNQKSSTRSAPLLRSDITKDDTKSVSDEDLSALNTLGRLLRTQRMEVASFREMVRASKQNNPIQTRAAIHAYEKAQRVVRQAEIDHHQEMASQKYTFSAEEVRDTLGKYLGGIRALLDAQPSSICARANPSDPECAKIAIQDSVNQILIAIQNAVNGAFK